MRNFKTPWQRCLLMLPLSLLLACGPGGPGGPGQADGVGNACVVDEDCLTKVCYLGPGGGYCTSPCTVEGDVSECPVDTVCKPIQGGARRCLLVCGSESACEGPECADDFCPGGSSCVSVGGTELRACEPDPG